MNGPFGPEHRLLFLCTLLKHFMINGLGPNIFHLDQNIGCLSMDPYSVFHGLWFGSKYTSELDYSYPMGKVAIVRIDLSINKGIDWKRWKKIKRPN